MISCQKATELIEKRSFSELTVYEKLKLVFHKSICTACTCYEKQSHLLDKLLQETIQNKAAEEAVPGDQEELKKRIISKLHGSAYRSDNPLNQ